MGNALQLVLKYGAVLVRYGKYIPILLRLYEFIRAAERDYHGTGSGAGERLPWVAERFRQLVTMFELAGWIKPALAKALRDGAEQLVTTVVEFLNAEEGGVRAAPAPDPPQAPIDEQRRRPNLADRLY